RERLGTARRATAEEIEEEITQVPEPVLDVVPEDVEVEHVAEDMEPAPVQEHAGQEVHEREVARHQAPAHDERVGLTPAERDLVAEHEQVARDDGVVDDRHATRRDGVAKRDHAPPYHARPVVAPQCPAGYTPAARCSNTPSARAASCSAWRSSSPAWSLRSRVSRGRGCWSCSSGSPCWAPSSSGRGGC